MDGEWREPCHSINTEILPRYPIRFQNREIGNPMLFGSLRAFLNFESEYIDEVNLKYLDDQTVIGEYGSEEGKVSSLLLYNVTDLSKPIGCIQMENGSKDRKVVYFDDCSFIERVRMQTSQNTSLCYNYWNEELADFQVYSIVGKKKYGLSTQFKLNKTGDFHTDEENWFQIREETKMEIMQVSIPYESIAFLHKDLLRVDEMPFICIEDYTASPPKKYISNFIIKNHHIIKHGLVIQYDLDEKSKEYYSYPRTVTFAEQDNLQMLKSLIAFQSESVMIERCDDDIIYRGHYINNPYNFFGWNGEGTIERRLEKGYSVEIRGNWDNRELIEGVAYDGEQNEYNTIFFGNGKERKISSDSSMTNVAFWGLFPPDFCVTEHINNECICLSLTLFETTPSFHISNLANLEYLNIGYFGFKKCTYLTISHVPSLHTVYLCYGCLPDVKSVVFSGSFCFEASQ